MTALNFDVALGFVYRVENDGQPFHNDPADPGGATTWGWTFSTWGAWCRMQGITPITLTAFQALTSNDLRVPYRVQFWNTVQGDALPSGVDVTLFDMAVLSSPFRAAQFLQHILGVDEDGHIGPMTLLAAKGADTAATVQSLRNDRESYYAALPTFSRFGHGWDRRANDCCTLSLTLVGT